MASATLPSNNQGCDDIEDIEIEEMLARAIGIIPFGNKLIYDPTEEPFKSSSPKSWKPSLETLRNEVTRRYLLPENTVTIPGNKKKPSSKKWSTKQCTEWLIAHPIQDDDQVATIVGQVMSFKEVLSKKQEKPNQVQWKSNFAYLRLIHCFVDDETIRYDYIRSLQSKTREQLDGRNSASRPETVYEKIAKRMNDDSFVPQTYAYPHIHPDFAERIYLARKDNGVVGSSYTTAEKVKEKIGEMRLRMLRVIHNFEASGQGLGGKKIVSTKKIISDDSDNDDDDSDDDESDDGNQSQKQAPNDTRRNFLGEKDPSYLLYFWELCDKFDFLAKVVQEIDQSIAASSAQSVPSIYKKPRTVSPVDDDGEQVYKNGVLQVLSSIRTEFVVQNKERSISKNTAKIDSLKKDIFDLQVLEAKEATNDVLKRLYAEQIAALQHQLDDLIEATTTDSM